MIDLKELAGVRLSIDRAATIAPGLQRQIDEITRAVEQVASISKNALKLVPVIPKMTAIPMIPKLPMIPKIHAIHTITAIPKLPVFPAIDGYLADVVRPMQLIREHVELVHYNTVKLPARNRRALQTWADHGWYLDPEMPCTALFEVAEALRSDQADEAENELCEHFDRRLDEIEAHLSAQFPHRAAILGEAFAVHRERRWALSIPVFLAQAEGITHDLTGSQLYARRGGAPVLASFVKKKLRRPLYSTSLLHPLTVPTPLNALPKERPVDSKDLHRHPVLHGESVTYPSHMNSARAVSLLAYLAWVLSIEPPSDDD